MESIDDALNKRFGKSLVYLMKVIDPDRKYTIDKNLGEKWDNDSFFFIVFGDKTCTDVAWYL